MLKRTMTFVGMGAAMALSSAALAVPTPTYLAKAGAGDLYEIQSSKIVASSTTNASLKSFATEMVTDHTKSTADIKAAAKSSGLTPKPPMLTPKQTADLAALRKASGAARDKLYITQQKAAHDEALALHQDYASSGDKPALKSTASAIVAVVQHHIMMLGQMPM